MTTIAMFIGLYVTIVLAVITTQLLELFVGNTDWYINQVIKHTAKASKKIAKEMEDTENIEELE